MDIAALHTKLLFGIEARNQLPSLPLLLRQSGRHIVPAWRQSTPAVLHLQLQRPSHVQEKWPLY